MSSCYIDRGNGNSSESRASVSTTDGIEAGGDGAETGAGAGAGAGTGDEAGSGRGGAGVSYRHFLVESGFMYEIASDENKKDVTDEFAGAAGMTGGREQLGKWGRQEIFTLIADLSDVRVKPVLSYDSLFGFETAGSVSIRTGAAAVVNAGFFDGYGFPSGLVVIDGEAWKLPVGGYGNPVLVISEGKARFLSGEIDVLINIIYRAAGNGDLSLNGGLLQNGGQSKKVVIRADSLNGEAQAGHVIIYTRRFGSTNRSRMPERCIVVEDGTVKNILDTDEEVAIPANGFLVSFFEDDNPDRVFGQSDPAGLKTGDSIFYSFMLGGGEAIFDGGEAEVETAGNTGAVNVPGSAGIIGNGIMPDTLDAYECGYLLVSGGKPVKKASDPWIGTLGNYDPRTAVGIMEDGRVLFVVVDGRRPQYSRGLTGDEMGALMVLLGAREAAMLDGGASSVIYFENTMMNKPSFRGGERPVGGCIAIFRE